MITISKYVYTHHISDCGGIGMVDMGLIIEIVPTTGSILRRCHRDFDNILTVGKIYEITKETSICPVTNLDLSRISFIADNGHFYLIELEQWKTYWNKSIFITLEECREKKLLKLGI